jgi:hypothetical protein
MGQSGRTRAGVTVHCAPVRGIVHLVRRLRLVCTGTLPVPRALLRLAAAGSRRPAAVAAPRAGQVTRTRPGHTGTLARQAALRLGHWQRRLPPGATGSSRLQARSILREPGRCNASGKGRAQGRKAVAAT